MALCKLGAAIAALDPHNKDTARNYAENYEFSLRDAVDYLTALDVTVGRETVRGHRMRLCACHTLTQMVEPGEVGAVSYATTHHALVDPETPTSVRERTQGAAVEPELRLRSKWQTASGDWRESYEAVTPTAPAVPIDDLLEIVSNYAPSYVRFTVREALQREDYTDAAYVVPVGDLQLGKPDGEGTAGIVESFCVKTMAARDRMLKLGSFATVVLPWLGDCIEGMVSQGGKLQLDIGMSEQLRLYRRLIMFQVEVFAAHCTELIIPVVPGNHDETRRDVATHATDSWAIEGAAAVSDALKLNAEAFGHVKFLFPPRNELTFSIDVAGTRLGFAHGHQCGKPGGAEAWWQGQSFGRQAVGDADILLTAHFHHLRIQNVADGRTWIQCPALDGGSDWFRHKTGANTPAGMCSFVVENGAWRDLTVH